MSQLQSADRAEVGEPVAKRRQTIVSSVNGRRRCNGGDEPSSERRLTRTWPARVIAPTATAVSRGVPPHQCPNPGDSGVTRPEVRWAELEQGMETAQDVATVVAERLRKRGLLPQRTILERTG